MKKKNMNILFVYGLMNIGDFPKAFMKYLKGRIAFGWTPEHFECVRSELSHIGLIMHEISRRPDVKEEIIS
jgi:hypothetical protein